MAKNDPGAYMTIWAIFGFFKGHFSLKNRIFSYMSLIYPHERGIRRDTYKRNPMI